MSFSEKCSSAQVLLREKGFSPACYSPFAFRVLWALGVPIPPPHFSGFVFNVLTLGGIFTLICVGISFLAHLFGLVQASEGSWLSPQVAIYGLVFGIVMASVFRYGARKYAVPPWSAFTPTK
jgi:hypothetical protein